MQTYIIRRLLLMIPTLFVVTVITFLLIRMAPGDAVDALVAQMEGQGAHVNIARETVEKALGLDVPIFTQYARWVGVISDRDGNFSGLLQGNLGSSFFRKDTVLEEIGRRWPVTLQLGFMGLIIAQLIALPIGIFSALQQDTWGDYIARSLAILAIAVPGFWIATMVIVFPAIWWGYMPPIMYVPFTEDPLSNLRMLTVPAIVLGMGIAGMTMRLTRAMMLEVLRQDYIRTAWAKGLRERVVVIRHALKNALIPVVSMVGLWLPMVIGGTVIIEQIFNLPGMGRLMVEATQWRDYPVVSGIMLFFGIGLLLVNLVVDLTYGLLDPRVHYN